MVLETSSDLHRLLPNGNGRPSVSVGMPVHNGERFLRTALDSLLAQSFADFELVVSDNASSDETRQICLEYAERDPRVRYCRTEISLDPVSNFNRALGLAVGEYFMWAAHDDIWDSRYIESLYNALKAEPGAILAFCRFDNIDENDSCVKEYNQDWTQIFRRSKFRQVASMTLLDEARTQKANHIYGLMRRKAILACGGMVSIPGMDYSGEDVLTLLRLLAYGDFVIVDRVLFHYRIRSLTSRKDERVVDYLVNRVSKRTAGHRGNLGLFFGRNHAYHSHLRKVVAANLSLSMAQRWILCLALVLKEAWMPIRTVPISALQEIALLR